MTQKKLSSQNKSCLHGMSNQNIDIFQIVDDLMGVVSTFFKQERAIFWLDFEMAKAWHGVGSLLLGWGIILVPDFKKVYIKCLHEKIGENCWTEKKSLGPETRNEYAHTNQLFLPWIRSRKARRCRVDAKKK